MMRVSSQVFPDEMAFMAEWLRGVLAGMPVFSFRYGEQASGDILEYTGCESSEWDGDTRAHTLHWRDDDTGLVCEMAITEFRDYPAVEWVLHFHNEGAAATPIITDVQALDIIWRGKGSGTPVLYRSRGSDEQVNDFEYLREEMRELRTPARTITMNAGDGSTNMRNGRDGRSSIDWLPFFNLQTGADGLITAIGWSGRWNATFAHDGSGNVHITAGMEYTHLRLHPGESIRTPRMLVLYWNGEAIHGHNVLRQFMLRHHTPRIDGEPAVAPLCNGAWGGAVTESHRRLIETIVQRELPYEYYWIDAGWYGTSEKPCPDVFGGEWWRVGDWRVNRHYHPDGLQPISDAIHAAGMKFLLWVEPERAMHGAPVTLAHPEWFLRRSTDSPVQDENLLLNLGHPDAWRYIVETVAGLIAENDIDCYREDFNYFGSLEAMLANDAPDRQGITEIRFIEGLYAFWDELRLRFPNLLIDNCSSGGRRIDLELLGRSIPLWRTDYNCFPSSQADAFQIHGVGLTHWVPQHATSPFAAPGDTYQVRSALAAGMVLSLDEFNLFKRALDDSYPWAWHRKMIDDYLRLRPFWLGDYYPLLTCTMQPDAWMAYQLHRPDLDAGAVVAFRRAESPLATAIFPLRGLTDGAVYTIEDADTGERWNSNSTELTLTITERRSARLLFYTRAE